MTNLRAATEYPCKQDRLVWLLQIPFWAFPELSRKHRARLSSSFHRKSTVKDSLDGRVHQEQQKGNRQTITSLSSESSMTARIYFVFYFFGSWCLLGQTVEVRNILKEKNIFNTIQQEILDIRNKQNGIVWNKMNEQVYMKPC